MSDTNKKLRLFKVVSPCGLDLYFDDKRRAKYHRDTKAPEGARVCRGRRRYDHNPV